MKTRSEIANDAARRLWNQAVGGEHASIDLVVIAERLTGDLQQGLGRWIGGDGYRTLLARSLERVHPTHSVLGGLTALNSDKQARVVLTANQVGVELGEGMVALLTSLIELLGRIIGDEMAVRLVEQASIPSPRGVVSIESAGGRDG